MNRHTGGIILFILFNCLPHLCTAAAYGDNCTDTSECTDGSYLECDADKCSCTAGYIANGTVCNADLGTDCSNVVSCYDQNAECVGTPAKCSCKNTHYDDNGVIDGGTCQLKKSLGQECPDPNTAPDTCSIGNSDCSPDGSSSTNYRCKCVSPYMEQTGTCVVDGIWGDWTQWSACSCGDSIVQQTRSRICNNPAPSNGGQDCVGSSSDTRQCAISACPVNGIWGNWTPWSNCSPTCGDSSGQQTRSRSCDSPAPSNGGNDCFGSNSDAQQCTISKCPVDGGLSEWLQWSSCTVSCAGGSRTRNRTCTNPTPQYGGKSCTDYLSETQACNSGACPEVEFGQTCTINGDKCKGTFTDCIGGTCKCISGYYRNGNACEAKIELGSIGCSTTASDSCKSPNAECHSDRYCRCINGYYDDNGNQAGGTCRQKIELGSNGCSTAVSDSCQSPDATCQSHGGYCRCNNGYYDDNGSGAGGGTCRQKIELGSTGCSKAVSDSCKSPHATCQSHGGSCTCNNGYYDDNGSPAGGTCRQKIALGSSGCSTAVTDSCMSPDATCRSNGGSCTCNNGYFDDNGSGAGGGTCRQKIELGSSGCSTAVSDSCRSPNAACQSHGGSCKCINGYYDDNGSLAGGTCMQRKDLGAQCSNITNECADANAACLDDKCTCGFFYYDDNGFNPGGSCESVSGLKVISIGFQSVTTSGFTVSWTPPSGVKASHINNYEVEWSLKISDNSLAGGNRLVPAGTTSFDISTGVTAGKTYKVKVISVNTNTRKDHPRTSFLTSEQASKPNKPRSLTTSDLDATDQRINIGWSAPSSGVAISYRVQLFDGTSELTSNDFTQTSGNIYYQTMKNGYHYDVKISARSELYQGRQGSSYEWSDLYVAKIKTTVQVPDPPSVLKCPTIRIFDKSIGLTWLAPAKKNGDIKGYKIEVLHSDKTLKKTLITNGEDTEYTVLQLDPGTRYFFRVYTVNENFTSSTFAASSNCDTEAPLAESPQNLSIFEIESRTSKMSWIQPAQIFSEENLGYSIQIKDEDVCIEEHIFICSNCIQHITVSNLKGLCNTDVRNASQKTKDVLNDKEMIHMYKATKLFPDILYSANVAAINNKGKGNIATIEWKTKEEEPQKPYNVHVTEINATYLKVSWDISGPRPGNTTFTVKLSAAGSAPSPEYKVIGFEQKSLMATQLEEFWNYTVTVTASTSVGSMRSDVSETYRTLPAAPGKVSSFNVQDAPREDYRKLKFVWKAPLELERNSVIKEYSYKHNGSGALQTPQTLGQDADENHEYSVELDVVPEEYYTFEVFAVNEQNLNGTPTNEILQTKAGVPVNIESSDVDVVEGKKKSSQQRQFTVTFAENFFNQTRNGAIRATGFVVCKDSKCDSKDSMNLSDFNTLDAWSVGLKKGYYRATEADWLKNLKSKTSTPNSRRKREVEVVKQEFIVGSDTCSSNTDSTEYCNGPVDPETSYIVIAVACTNGGCLISKKYGPFVTAAVPDDATNLGLIIGIIVAAVVIIVLAAVIIVLVLRRRRGRKSDGMKRTHDTDDEDVNFDPATEKIPRKRPINLNEIEEYVANMHKDSNLLFSAEYEELKTLSPKHACEAADREENRMRNRYINIIPFDHSRVKLSTNGEDDSADYINGNYLPGYNSPREYIGCQGPIPGTIDDFWRMTWEQNVSVIVMLTLCKEGQKIKCEQYWPDEVGEPKQYGDVIVEITSYSNIRTYDYRMFRITNGSTTRVVKHFHFLSWLDFQANVHHDIILDFIQHVRQHVQPPDTSGPMIIHCSAGVGRTGTYIALDHLMQFINEHDFDVEIDIFDLVLKLRENRQHMVQTEQQYVFIHDCVKEIMERKRRQMENIYENQGFSQDENIYQNEQSLYANVSISKAEQNTEL